MKAPINSCANAASPSVIALNAAQVDRGLELLDCRRRLPVPASPWTPVSAIRKAEFRQDAAQAIDLDRLGQIAVHARRFAALAVAAHGIRGQRNDRHVSRGFQFADFARCGHAVHDRHLQIHEHDVKSAAPGTPRNAFRAVVRDFHAASEALEKLDGDLLIDEIVFHQQYLTDETLLRRCLRRAYCG